MSPIQGYQAISQSIEAFVTCICILNRIRHLADVLARCTIRDKSLYRSNSLYQYTVERGRIFEVVDSRVL